MEERLPDPDSRKKERGAHSSDSRNSTPEPHDTALMAPASGMELGLQLVLGTGLGGVGGFLLDRWLSLAPWCMVAGLIWGAAAGFLGVIRSSGRPVQGDVKNSNDKSDGIT